MELIIGSVVSLVLFGLKKWLGETKEWVTLLGVLILSVLGAGIVFYLQNIGVWESFLGILTTAGAFYAFIIRRFVK